MTYSSEKQIINELRLEKGSLSNLQDGDIVIVFRGNIYPIHSSDNTIKNVYYTFEVIKKICEVYEGYTDVFFEPNGVLPNGRLFLVDGHYSMRKITDAIHNFNEVPKLLLFDVVMNPDGIILSTENYNGSYDILNSKELHQFASSPYSESIQEYEIDGHLYKKEDIIHNNTYKQNIPIAAKLFHGTCMKYAVQILKNGLRSSSSNSVYNIHNEGYVFLTTSLNIAYEYADTYARKTQTSPCVLEINSEYINRNNIVLDFDFTKSFTNDFENSPFDSDKMQNRYFKGEVAKSSGSYGSKFSKIGYKGIIFPKAINGIYVGEKYYTKQDFITKFTMNNESKYYINEVDAEDISLSSFKAKEDLNPRFWIDDKLNSRIRERLLDIAYDFIDELTIPDFKPKDIVFTGSLANYNWSRYSDIDVHIVVSFKSVYKKTDLIDDYFKSKKEIWNQTHDKLKIYGYPVEISVEDADNPAVSSGVYSLIKNKWLKEPSDFDDARLNEKYIKDFAAKTMTNIDNVSKKISKEKSRSRLEEYGEKMLKLFKRLKNIRKEGLARSGEMSSGNIIYKVLRRAGYLDRIWDIVNTTYNKMNSIK